MRLRFCKKPQCDVWKQRLDVTLSSNHDSNTTFIHRVFIPKIKYDKLKKKEKEKRLNLGPGSGEC